MRGLLLGEDGRVEREGKGRGWRQRRGLT